MEQEAIYETYVEENSPLPLLKYFNFVVPESQDTVRIKSAIISCFEDHGMGEIIEKINFIGSDCASVSCGKKLVW